MIVFDYETKSGLDIDVGKHRYLTDPQADIVCLAYCHFGQPIKFWTPRLPLPEEFRNPTNYTWVAFNSEFDRAVTNILGKRYGMGYLPLENTIDIMSVCGRFSLPQSLDKAGDALNLKTRKDPKGKALMKKICCPPFKHTEEELKAFYRYCIQDVNTLCAMIQALPAPKLVGTEREIWEHTVRVNERGLPIDQAAVARIQAVIEHCTKILTRKLQDLTGGEIQTAGQRDKILAYLRRFDVELPDLTAGTVKEALELVPLDSKAHAVLTIRQQLGGAAVKKYPKILQMVKDSRLHDNLRYCGAGHTGRDSGMGFQLQNLPRASVENPEAMIQKFYDTTILKEPDPLFIAKALIRSMIRAKSGKQILAGDFSSIEYVMLMWFCQEYEKLQRFRNGVCPYKVFASSLLGKPYADIIKQERQDSKPGILGGGYCLSGRSLIKYAADMGVDIGSEEEANAVIKLYRADHSKVVESWDALVKASVNAVLTPKEVFPVLSASFRSIIDGMGRKWLELRLPSGRALYYANPTITESYGRMVVQHMGVNSLTKKWCKHILRASVLINNVIQGIARDVMMTASLALEKAGFHVIGRCHDEIICEEGIGDKSLIEMLEIMGKAPSWCADAPIKAEGFAGERYKKG